MPRSSAPSASSSFRMRFSAMRSVPLTPSSRGDVALGGAGIGAPALRARAPCRAGSGSHRLCLAHAPKSHPPSATRLLRSAGLRLAVAAFLAGRFLLGRHGFFAAFLAAAFAAGLLRGRLLCLLGAAFFLAGFFFLPPPLAARSAISATACIERHASADRCLLGMRRVDVAVGDIGTVAAPHQLDRRAAFGMGAQFLQRLGSARLRARAPSSRPAGSRRG